MRPTQTPSPVVTPTVTATSSTTPTVKTSPSLTPSVVATKRSVKNHEINDPLNATAYNFITNLYTTAELPISAVIISIILILELARNATHMEGDHQMGVKIIAATMFKPALLVIAAQNSTMFLNAFNEVSSKNNYWYRQN